ncbi:MAG: DDE-type integrase/transposase/recombinase [Solibacillus sp.]
MKKKHKFKVDQGPEMVAPSVLARSFSAAAPNEKWVTGITYIQYSSTTMYLAAILDLFNNEIVAYKMYDHQQTPLVMDVLKAALEARHYPFRTRHCLHFLCLSKFLGGNEVTGEYVTPCKLLG